MCNPAAAMAGLQITQALVQQQGAKKQARAEREAATAAYGAESAQLQLKALQTAQQSREEISQRTREALVERSRLRTAAGESGLTGASITRAIAQPEVAAGLDIGTMIGNRQAQFQQIGAEQQSSYARYRSRMNAAVAPSNLMTGLTIAGAGLDYLTSTQKPSTQTPKG